jgi:serine/threonine protein kinase
MPKNCQLGAVLSYGSEGIVHSGTWHGAIAAIKVFANQHARRVESEAKLVMNLDHIHIIKYFDLEYEQNLAYLAMEYITGGNLYEFIRTQFTSNSYWATVTQILIDVARGMAYLHDHHIVQGDLKSHNILLRDGNQQAVICDFGISRSLDNDNQTKKRPNTTKGKFHSNTKR